MKKILVVIGHPVKNNLCHALAKEYCKGAKETGHKVKVLDLASLDITLKLDAQSKSIGKWQKLIKWADHLVFFYPTWLAGPPSLLKAFLEITLVPDFAYKYKKSKILPKWDQHLKGKSARIISTMDAPAWYYRIFRWDPGFRMMKTALNFVGIKTVTRRYFGLVSMSSLEDRKRWLRELYEIGKSEK